MAAGPISERNQDATIYVGGLDEKVTESLLWELFVQVHIFVFSIIDMFTFIT